MAWNNVLVSGLIVLGIVIFVHELGHFLVAKWRGVRVLKFSLGFGPAMFAFTRGETEYRLSWIPLGGYVQMAGDSPGDDQSMPSGQEQFLSHHWFGRLLIAIAGPAANLVTAFVVLLGVYLFLGISYSDYPNRLGPTPDSSVAYQAGLREGDRIVRLDDRATGSWAAIFDVNQNVPRDRGVTLTVERGGGTFALPLAADEREPLFSSLRRPPEPAVVASVSTGMPAYKVGLKEGDVIRAVDGRPIAAWEDLPKAFRGRADQPVRLEVERDGRRIPITVTPIHDARDPEQGLIGIGAPRHDTYVERVPPARAVQYAFVATSAIVRSVYEGMWLTVTRFFYYREYLGGPLFIAQAASEQAKRGLDSFLQFIALINIAVMAFNLLPLPLLDGGHILLALVEAVRRQGLSARSYVRFQKVGLVVIGAIFLLILANDPWRILQRQRALGRAPQETPVATPP